MEKIIETLVFTPAPDNNTETHITITEGDFAGTTFKFGRVWFPDENEPILSFDYDVINATLNVGSKKTEFLNLIGAILQNVLLCAVEEQTAIYTGGAAVEEGVVEEIIESSPSLFEPPPVDSKILTPWSYKLPEPEPGTKMSRNLLEGL